MSYSAENLPRNSIILLVESDARLKDLLIEGLGKFFRIYAYSSLIDAARDFALRGKWNFQQLAGAIVEIKTISKDELARFAGFFPKQFTVPIFVTLNYSGDFQIHEQYIRGWTNNIIFRPYEVENLLKSVLSQLEMVE
jgi:hypothetical protein